MRTKPKSPPVAVKSPFSPFRSVAARGFSLLWFQVTYVEVSAQFLGSERLIMPEFTALNAKGDHNIFEWVSADEALEVCVQLAGHGVSSLSNRFQLQRQLPL